MFLSISPTDYAQLEAKAKQEMLAKHPKIVSFTPNGDTRGIIVTPDVTLDYYYDAGQERLYVNIGARHSLAAKVAPQQVIEAHIIKTLHELEPVVEETPEEVIPVENINTEVKSPFKPAVKKEGE